MNDDDPVPLKAGGEAAPELVRALFALRSERPDALRRARISERLAVRLAFLPERAPAWRNAKLLAAGAAILAAIGCAAARLAG